MTDDPEILFETTDGLGVITLNRPKALNALNLSMIREMDPVLARWAGDDSVKAVLVKGAGEKAFCAGGDVRAVWQAGKDGDPLTSEFFWSEYRLNRRIHTYAKPYVALLDGVTMGGGAGLSVHGSHRVATERLTFAMPETGIGFFPDIGGSWFLNQCPGETGTYLALTGARIGAADAAAVGLVTAYVPSDGLAAFEADLAAADWSQPARAAVDGVVARHAQHPGEPQLAPHRALIDRCFAHDTLEEILAALETESAGDGDDADFAAKTLETLAGKSPTSMKIALAEIRRADGLDFDACMRMEYRISQALMRKESDFYEGIRAVLVDKDHAPNWNPATAAAIDDATLESFFAPAERELAFD